MLAPITVLLVVGLAANSALAQKEVCEKLSQCLAEVQAKGLSCQQAAPAATTVASTADPAKAQCADAIKSKTEAFKALLQRKADAFGTCINSKAAFAVVLTNTKKKEKCEALLARQARARRQADDEDKPKKAGRRGGSRRARPKVSEQSDPTCQSELRQMRSRCAKLSKCCSVTKECREGGEPSLAQEITAARVAMRTQIRECHAAKAGKKANGRRARPKGRGNKANTTAAPPTTKK